MSSSEEEDYMSAALLGACVDIRPGLVHGKHKRQLEQSKKKASLDKTNKEKNKPKKVLEAEKREEGMQTALSEENKGFKLMAKMGFKTGMALGKRESGRKDPITIEVRTSRGGLGIEMDRKRRRESQVAMLLKRRKATEKTTTEDYQKRMREKFTSKKTTADLRDAQNVCMQLDMKAEWKEPTVKWYWPQSWWESIEGEKEEDEEAEAEDDSKNPQIQEEEEKLKDAQIHVEEVEEETEDRETEDRETEDGETEDGETEDGEDDYYWEDEEEELEPSEKLHLINDYLRTTYWYCSWCGTQYDNEEAMANSCPSSNEEDHG